MTQAFEDRTWRSADGLTLYYRYYNGPADRPALLCLHGLTRNSRDFAELAERYAGDWRIIVPDMRGRGRSEHAKDSMTYVVPTYLADVALLLEQEKMERFVSIGTSMGGLMTMLMAQIAPDKIAGALLNDIGPAVETEGLAHIRTYLGHQRTFPTWMHAARAIQETQQVAHPTWELEDWLKMAKNSMVLGQNGRIGFDYDMAIADPFNEIEDNAVPPDLWPAFEALAGRPVTLIRGGLSGLLKEETAAEMQRRMPGLDLVTIADVGHAPALTEPEAIAAIDRLLAKVAG